MTPEEYLKEHTLDPKFVKETLGWNWKEKKIVIPIYGKDSKHLFNKYRELEGSAKFTYDEGKHPILYPLWLIKKAQHLYFVEGEPDAARLWQEKIPAITTVGGVESFREEMAVELAGHTVSLILDNDEAGQKSISKYINILERLNIPVLIVKLPEEFKDVCEFFAKRNKEEFLALPQLTPDTWLIEKYTNIYPILTNKEFLEKKYPEKKWLIHPFIRATGLILLVGEGGVGKTLVSYSFAKAISEGRNWLNKYPATKGKVLILDKENDEIDIQENLYAQQATSSDILHYTAARDFSFFDEAGKPSEAAIYLNTYVKVNKITTILMDSMIDFYVGNENDAVDAANNILAWRQTFPYCAIMVLQHENKPSQEGKKRFAGHRVRGSTHLVNTAQSILSFSVPEQEYPEKIMVEHTKIRGAKKQNPFMIEMVSQGNPTEDDPDATIITGFKFAGEVIIQKKKKEEAVEAILEHMEKDPTRHFVGKDFEIELSNVIENKKNIEIALPYIRANKLCASDTTQKPYTYWFLTPEKIDDYIDNLEKEAAE